MTPAGLVIAIIFGLVVAVLALAFARNPYECDRWEWEPEDRKADDVESSSAK